MQQHSTIKRLIKTGELMRDAHRNVTGTEFFLFLCSMKNDVLVRSDRPEGEHTEFLHHVKFASLVKVENIWEQTWISIKIKLLLLHVIVITHLQQQRR